MTDDRFIPYREAMGSQAARLQDVAAHVLDQVSEQRLLLASQHPVFLGIGASLAAAALPVSLLRSRGVAAHRAGVGDLPEGSPALGDALIAVSQSGRSRETIEALNSNHGALRAAVVNVPGSPLTQVASSVVDLGSQSDSKASTIGFTGTLLALGILADHWDARVPSQTPPDASQPWAAVGDLVGQFAAETETDLSRLCEHMSGVSSIDVVGPQASVTSAEEGALLLREVCRVPATAFELRNYLHGPEESARPRTAQGPTGHLIIGRERSLQLAEALTASGHVVALVTDLPSAATSSLAQSGTPVVTVPVAHSTARVIIETVALQTLALGLADAHGVPPDEFLNTSLDTKIDDLAMVQGPV